MIGGVESVFRWKGKTQRDREVLLLVKTRAASFERLRRAVISLHPYEVPEIVAVGVAKGHQPYVRWVVSSVP
jgi:periplasmic divalent cation tolerance protein